VALFDSDGHMLGVADRFVTTREELMDGIQICSVDNSFNVGRRKGECVGYVDCLQQIPTSDLFLQIGVN
jgi:hypothetical protein